MALPNQTNVPEIVQALITAWFTFFRLQRLEYMVDRQYNLADRETTLAELLYTLQKTFRARDGELFDIVKASPTYEQKYDCAVLRANVNTARELVAQRQAALKATSAYQHGRMRDITQLTANSLMTLSMPKKLDAYRFEDALTDTLLESRFNNLVNSITSRMFSPGRVYASLGRYYESMTDTMADSATRGLEDVSYHFGRIYESFKDKQTKRSPRSEVFDTMSDKRRLEIASGRHIQLELEQRQRLATEEVVEPSGFTNQVIPVEKSATVEEE